MIDVENAAKRSKLDNVKKAFIFFPAHKMTRTSDNCNVNLPIKLVKIEFFIFL